MHVLVHALFAVCPFMIGMVLKIPGASFSDMKCQGYRLCVGYCCSIMFLFLMENMLGSHFGVPVVGCLHYVFRFLMHSCYSILFGGPQHDCIIVGALLTYLLLVTLHDSVNECGHCNLIIWAGSKMFPVVDGPLCFLSATVML